MIKMSQKQAEKYTKKELAKETWKIMKESRLVKTLKNGIEYFGESACYPYIFPTITRRLRERDNSEYESSFCP